jgi:hypothetical protein
MDVGGSWIEAQLYSQLPPLPFGKLKLRLQRAGGEILSGIGSQLGGF